jgi:hypothetical protein
LGPIGVRFLVNDAVLERRADSGERVPLAVRLGRRRKPSAVGYLARFPEALPEDDRGLAVSTLGKVIKRGWDWLGLTPSDPARIAGLIEVPGLAESLTLNKADFIRTGPRGALYLAYRKGIQEAAAGPLAAWGSGKTNMRAAMDMHVQHPSPRRFPRRVWTPTGSRRGGQNFRNGCGQNFRNRQHQGERLIGTQR